MNPKIAIVTGGSSGIGRCTAIALRDAGCKVYEFSRREKPIEGVCHIGLDVTDEASIQTTVEQILTENGRIDILVNCAGNGISGAVELTELSDAKAQFEVNFFGMVNMNKAVLPIMRKRRFGGAFLRAVKGKNGEERVTINFVTVGSFVGSFWPF